MRSQISRATRSRRERAIAKGPGPFESVSRWEIRECVPLRLQVHVGQMPEMHMELRIELRPEGLGTRWSQKMGFGCFPGCGPLSGKQLADRKAEFGGRGHT